MQPETYYENINFNGHNIVLGSLFLTTGDTLHISLTIIDGDSSGSVATFESWEDSTTTITGFTIQNGYSGNGGGIYCLVSNPTITHCIIRENFGNYGAVYCFGANPTITHCTITYNQPYGIYLIGSHATIDSCIVSDNWELFGAGIYCDTMSYPMITNSIIRGNSGGSHGAGIIVKDGSGPTISHCIISENFGAPQGSGISCRNASETIIEYCTITGNTGVGGAIGIDYSYNTTIDHCTISGNSCGGVLIWNSDPTILNTIVANNTGGSGGIEFYSDSNTSVTYSDVFNNQPENFAGQVPPGLGELTTTNANGDSCDVYMNIMMDPMFVDPVVGDYSLESESPSIDAGDPASSLDPDSTITDIGAFFYDQSGYVEDPFGELAPETFRLLQNYPNPFNAATVLTYSIPQPGQTTLTIWNIMGRKVVTLYQGMQAAGTHKLTWNATEVSSGIYFAHLQSGNHTRTIKMVLLK